MGTWNEVTIILSEESVRFNAQFRDDFDVVANEDDNFACVCFVK